MESKIFAIILTLLSLGSCRDRVPDDSAASAVESADTSAVLAVDTVLNRSAAFYAGVSCEGVAMSAGDSAAWSGHAKSISSLFKKSKLTLDGVDTLVTRDMSDIREKCDYVFYPFSGPDFLYPITIAPDAGTYFLIGLEQPGSPFGPVRTGFSQYQYYRTALTSFLYSSFFRTLSMKDDLSNNVVDGTVPLILLMMKLMDCSIISVTPKAFSEEGEIVDSRSETSSLAEIRFCRNATPSHEQVLYYLSTNLKTYFFDPSFKKYLERELPKHNVLSYAKAASYLMHHDRYSQIREIILEHSFAVIEDDSGVPYRFFKGWDVTLYGKYIHPLTQFGEEAYQLDLKAAYNAPGVRPLPIRIGYNNPSNWMCARKKSAASTR